MSIKNIGTKDIMHILAGVAAGFGLFVLTSHQKSPVHKRLPQKSVKNISFLPHIKVSHKEKHYHLHHWMNMLSIYALLLLVRRKHLKSRFAHGFFLGSILQGLLYKDRFHIRHVPEVAASN